VFEKSLIEVPVITRWGLYLNFCLHCCLYCQYFL